MEWSLATVGVSLMQRMREMVESAYMPDMQARGWWKALVGLRPPSASHQLTFSLCYHRIVRRIGYHTLSLIMVHYLTKR